MMRADILMCGIGSDACGCLYNKGAVVTEALVPLDKRDLFTEGAIALEALSDTTKGDADIVVMNSTCQSPKFFEARLPRILPMKRAVWRCITTASR